MPRWLLMRAWLNLAMMRWDALGVGTRTLRRTWIFLWYFLSRRTIFLIFLSQLLGFLDFRCRWPGARCQMLPSGLMRNLLLAEVHTLFILRMSAKRRFEGRMYGPRLTPHIDTWSSRCERMPVCAAREPANDTAWLPPTNALGALRRATRVIAAAPRAAAQRHVAPEPLDAATVVVVGVALATIAEERLARALPGRSSTKAPLPAGLADSALRHARRPAKPSTLAAQASHGAL
mmetsp:Transcript_63207/g.137460  ORF Transcript_63207/g.137460 Transcript_63207/m.137460 type:complete len:233 (+) Transcript_63207:183-881(+)